METYTLSESQPPPVTPPEGEQPKTGIQKYMKFIIIAGVIVGFILMFVLGLAISRGGNTANQTATTPTPTPKNSQPSQPAAGVPNASETAIAYLPGKEYLDDAAAIVTKEEPHRTIFLSATRLEQEKNFIQHTKVNYYTGEGWLRESVTNTNAQGILVTNPLIRVWRMPIENKSASGQFIGEIAITIENQSVTFSLQKLSPESSIRTLPGFTKFTQFGEGVLKTAEGEQQAYIVFTQTYTSDAASMSHFANPERLKTNWFAFWDTTGKAYYLDTIESGQKANAFQNATIGVFYDPETGTMKKTNQATVSSNQQPNQYSLSLNFTPSIQITYMLNAPLNKVSSQSYAWKSGYVTGKITSGQNPLDGVGIMDVIQTP